PVPFLAILVAARRRRRLAGGRHASFARRTVPARSPLPLPTDNEVILGRQPISDTTGAQVAFALLFPASSAEPEHARPDDLHASSQVIARVLADIGVGASLGRFTGYVNADRALLMSEMVELLPPGRFVLEILETTEIDAELGERVGALR